MRNKRIKALLVAAITVVPLSIIVAPTAIAGAAGDLCPDGKICIYQDANYIGLLGWRSAGLKRENVSSGANDKTSSWRNRNKKWNARWYEHVDKLTPCHTMPLDSSKNDLFWFAGNDTLSS